MYKNIRVIKVFEILEHTLDMKRIYNFVRELWAPKDLNWILSVKAAPVRTGKLVTWIRDALVGVRLSVVF